MWGNFAKSPYDTSPLLSLVLKGFQKFRWIAAGSTTQFFNSKVESSILYFQPMLKCPF
jgi:hypothetical protein